jgi:hypothetical protein
MDRPRTFGRWLWLWMLGYAALVAALVWGMFTARSWALRELIAPAALADWQSWREDVRVEQQQPTQVQRRVPKSTEPPMLVLMRDYFPVSFGGAILFSTVLYWIIAWLVNGIFSSTSTRQMESTDFADERDSNLL